MALPRLAGVFAVIVIFIAPTVRFSGAADGSKFAHHDSDARYLHQIHLYDTNNRRIAPDSTTPISIQNTCGRCHDYKTISHGWHFNAFGHDSADGRQGEPWIWTDSRTGTQLPLSYRDWEATFDPRTIGIDQWLMTRQFGGRIPGGGLGAEPESDSPESEADATETAANSRWSLTGSLEIDCLACHGVSGSYDLNARRDQVEKENFAWAPTASMMMGTVSGEVSRLKNGSDPEDESTQAKMPKVAYDTARFAADGTVFIDLIRKPQNNACYQCHSQRTADDQGIQQRWIHDEDVHLRAGMQCVDCHRNGIDHHITRGYDGEEHPSGEEVVTLSCAGCHMGKGFVDEVAGRGHVNAHDLPTEMMAGRLGSPMPEHAGLPPVHFEKLSCTACHGGPLPREEALGVMTSLAHSIGSKGHRSGQELPLMSSPVYRKGEDGRVYPHRVVWPAYWGSLKEGKITPLDPDAVYEATRRSLRVRKSFREEILSPKLSSKEMKELLGDERYRTKEEEWSDEEARKVADAKLEAGQVLFSEKVYASIEAIQKAFEIEQAVYVSSGFIYAAGKEEDTLEKIELEDTSAIDAVAWPMAHNVRPAGWSLGIKGCLECHSEQWLIFASTVRPRGPGPDQG
ncbi:MAG: hypothetical protein AAF802_14880, partial [Planctomycetota bacterium]